MSEKLKILVVEDDSNLGFVIKDNLEMDGYDVVLCEDGKTGLQVFTEGDFDLCILDIMMPRKDGFTLAGEIREMNNRVPIVFLTARAMKEDKLKGFRLGGDDYITKPFSMVELLLRVRAILKRTAGSETNNGTPVYVLGKFVFDYNNLQLESQEVSHQLTQKEGDMLKLLCDHKGEILTREVALTALWGDNDFFAGRSMDVFISRIRKYLKKDETVQISTVHGVGFRLED